MRIALVLVLLLALAGGVWAQDVLYEEHFTDGSLNLDWFSPWEGGDVLSPTPDDTAPSGDGWVGFLATTGSGGGVGTSCAGTMDMTDYRVTAEIYTIVSSSAGGPYNGVVARLDTTGGQSNMSFYYFRADFDTDHRLQLRKYPGTSGMGDDILVWSGDEIPGGAPTESSWHTLALEVEGDQLSAFYDGELLSGCPVTDTESTHGFFGIYAFDFMQLNGTTADDIVAATPGGSAVDDQPVISLPSTIEISGAWPNPFNPSTTISFTTQHGLANASLVVYDLLGRPVADLANGPLNAGRHTVVWNAVNMPAGVYFANLQADGVRSVRKLVLMK